MPFTIPNLAASPTAEQTAQSQVDTVDLTALALGANATGVMSGGAVVQHAAGANMTVDVSAITYRINGTPYSAAGITTTTFTSNGSNPEFALVVATSAGVTAIPPVGTASATPVFPTVAGLTANPPTAVLLAALWVATSTTTISTADIIDKRVFIPGAHVDFINTASLSASTYTIPNNYDAHLLTLGNNAITVTMPTAFAGLSMFVALNQDGTGSRVPTFTGVKWPGGVVPVWSTAASAKDRVSFYCFDGSTWEGYPAGLAVA